MKEIYLENNDRTSGRERTLQWTDKVSLHHTKTWSGHEHMTTSLVTQPHYTTLSNDMVSMPPANTKIKDNISADHHMLVWEGHMVMYYLATEKLCSLSLSLSLSLPLSLSPYIFLYCFLLTVPSQWQPAARDKSVLQTSAFTLIYCCWLYCLSNF